MDEEHRNIRVDRGPPRRGRGGQHGNWRARDENPKRPRRQHENNVRQPNENFQNENRNRGPRQRFMGFKYVQELLNKDDLNKVVLELSNDRNGFSKLLESEQISDDLIVLVVKLMSKICDVTFDEAKLTVLQTALKSTFIDKLNKFIAEIVSQTAKSKERNKFFWNDTDEFWKDIITISAEVHNLMPSLACEVIRKTLLGLHINLPHIELTHSIHISEEIKASIESLLQVVNKTAETLEQKRQLRARDATIEEFEEPPDDFRDIPVMPSVIEVTTDETPYYRPNIIDRPYESVHQYLDIQFRLLREDFLGPLRKGICSFIHNEKKNVREKIQNIKIYKAVRFLNIETVNDQNCYRLQFDFSKKKRNFNYENSRRFMFGSLMCFTKDKFVTLLFAKIVQRDIKLLEKGHLIVGFSDDVPIDFDSDYLMVESSCYFEPYYQVLNVLKKMQPEHFPMEKYIIKVENSDDPPEYLLKIDPVFYEIEDTEFWPLNFPPTKFYGLNEAQLVAFKSALTKEFCIIQGPPGTGKTYLGLKIAHTLLNNKDAWYKKTPMLVICYTNTALDQFLEGLLPATKNLLRIGGQSKNENLNKYNLKNKRRSADPAVHQKYREVRDCMSMIKGFTEQLQKMEENESVFDFDVFVNAVPEYRNTWFYHKKKEDIKTWLLGGRQRIHENQNRRVQGVQEGLQNVALGEQKNEDNNEAEEDFEDLTQDRHIELDDIFDNLNVNIVRPFFSLSDIQQTLTRTSDNLRVLDSQPDTLEKVLLMDKMGIELNQLHAEYRYIQFRLEQWEFTPKQMPDFCDLQNPHRMDPDSRWQLYFYWLYLYQNSLKRAMIRAGETFKRVYKTYNELRDMDNVQTMKEHLVVGMTTTGAARLQSSLQALKSPIVIVEEAAEVLEAHIVAALTNYCKHLILIGDHQQLKPSTASYNIETYGKLGISMFERMVINKIQCYTLDIQHRMRPEIARLVCPTIYPNLKDHENTLTRNHIQGVEHDLYFIDHQEPESDCQDNSKKNVHEALFIISLARHLVLNGYKPEQITILAAYLGQFFEMQREKKKHALLLKDVRIAVLDNYQGEECDIVLLSLVRSNAEKKIGFLKIENRVCVALSRARDGFYIIGNMSHLCENSEIWPKIRKTLSDQNAIGPQLTLRCQIHRTITYVSSAGDFDNIIEGGCSLKCDAVMRCGHICKRLCHIEDREHAKNTCYEPCDRLLCNDPAHVCKKKCYEECGPCTYLVVRALQCGHNATIECHVNPDEHKCKTLVSTKLPCDHETDKPCHADRETFRCPYPCDSRVEPCGHACEKKCHIRFDPDHLQYHCRRDCEKSRIGCMDVENPAHKCPRMCFQDCEECEIGVKKRRSCGHMETIACKVDVEQITCQKPCRKTLPCGHKCKSKCCEACAPCKMMVDKIVPGCGHKVKIECHKEPNRSDCKGQCPRPLQCGHKCNQRCCDECSMNICKEIVECNIQSPCGHLVKTIQCHLRNTTDATILLKKCTNPCGVKLKCGDICTGTCGECMQGRIHKKCKEKCGRILVCNHACPLPCRQACQPCQKPCEYRCSHSKCKKKCGEPCTQCTMLCNRRCKHQMCKKKCGQLCSVPPCVEKCPKKLKCGHDCVGFCGDPCPKLCRVCNKDELEEIFFGTEDDEDSIFVELNDCGHIFESSGLEQWMGQNSHEVQGKVCPKCKSPIIRTQRFSDYVKRVMMDIIEVKKKEFGRFNDNNKLREKLLADMSGVIAEKFYLFEVCPDLRKICSILEKRLLTVKGNRRQPINRIELNTIKLKIQMLEYIIDSITDTTNLVSDETANDQLTLLLRVLIKDETITIQEIADMEFEINRLKRMLQLSELKHADKYETAYNEELEVRNMVSNIVELINTKGIFSNTIDEAIHFHLKSLSKKIDECVKIPERLRREIVAAMSSDLRLEPGHWFKCPNGHYYTIGECGGAMQESKCPDCGAKIGGGGHRLLEDNRFAPEMDGAAAPAWPGTEMNRR